MYVGRIVAIARTRDGRIAAGYRVSSRSFPNRMTRAEPAQAWILPRPGHEGDIQKNPYIAYRCALIVGQTAVVTNGSQTDAIAEKIAVGMEIRDAMASVMLALDYEKDDYNTPRIAAAVRAGAQTAFLGVVRKDGLEVRELAVPEGKAIYIATYEINTIDPGRLTDFAAESAEAGARWFVNGAGFAELTNPVTSVCALESAGGFALAGFNVG